jgi:OmpA-OmpF porin, OOP family
VKWLSDNPDISIVIEGHADPSGQTQANQELSEARATQVRDYLVEKGIDSSRLKAFGFGSSKLKYGASDGRNRRVVFVVK